MGVPKLWDILNKAGESRALAQLAVVDGFDKNAHGTRSFRLGIDVGIWLRHALHSAGGKHDYRGDSPELCTLFYRLCRLSRFPFSILFIFDGRSRPQEKRGSRMSKSGTHNLAPNFQKLIDIFGMDWREAKGEAEAELGRLSALGHIDAVLTDDADTFLFGARMLLKNVSLNLTGNKAHPALNLNGKPCDQHATVYTAQAFRDHPEVRLTRAGLILTALLSGGDYDSGVFGVGTGVGHALARLGYGDQLLHAYTTLSADQFHAWLPGWRADMTLEVQTNASGLMATRRPSTTIPATFPSMDTLAKYVRPALFAHGGGPPADRVAIDVPALAGFCEQHFTEWGYRAKILYRFTSLVYEGVVFTALRRAALIADKRETDRRVAAGMLPGEARVRAGWQPSVEQAVGTPAALVNMCAAPPKAKKAPPKDVQMRSIAGAFVRRGTPEPEPQPQAQVDEDEALLRRAPVREEHPLVVAIHGTRQHVSTDRLLEYRVEICVKQLAIITELGIKGRNEQPVAGASGSRGRGRGRGMGRGRGRGAGRGRGKDWVPNMNPGRRSKRYEDTESESEDPPPPPQLQPQAQAQPEPDPEIDGASEDDEPAAPGAAKKKKDPEANIRMWVPASIMRHVHPALVAEYEERQAAKRAPKKRAIAAAGAPTAVPAAAAVPAPARAHAAVPAPVAIPTAIPAVIPAAVSAAIPAPAPVAAQDAGGAAPAPIPARARATKGKGKAPARPTALEKEILRANPNASFAPPAAPVDVFALSSLPLRNCGFVFTWPETDDPDALIVDTDARDDLPTEVDYDAVELEGGATYREYEEAPVHAAKPRARRAPAAAAAAISSVAGVHSAIDRPSAATGLSSVGSMTPSASTARAQGTVMQIETPTNAGTRKGKERAAPELLNEEPAAVAASAGHSRGRGLLAQLDDWNFYGDYQAAAAGTKRKSRAPVSSSPVKRSRVDLDDALYTMRDSSEEPDLPWQSSAPSARSSSPAYNPRSSPVPGPPPSSSPAPTRSSSRSVSAAPRRNAALDAEVISISSDSDGEAADGGLDAGNPEREWWNMPPFNHRPSFYSQRRAASSQASLASSAAAEDTDVGMDVEEPWAVPAVPSASSATPVGKRPQTRPRDPATVKPRRVTGSSSSAGGASGRRVYRGEPVPSSSQESMLNEDVFFEDASLFVNLSRAA
ncbi:Flap endonuclease GEN -like protein [Trametes pubescens]|uniref:Flap endonuclease GEN-like protein n=1 Tax=Trametes pubescens TaxID=154538 RepID=A0A1M2VU44_TRAPU|nr:Flap endonuclease GEN -like protein [Trametes pubescens]